MKPEPGSDDVNEKDALVVLILPLGPELIDVSGGRFP